MNPRVLLVDDDVAVVAALTGVLRSEGYDVVQAFNGAQALVKFPDGNFDILLMDLRMPGRSGWETFSLLAWSRPLLSVIIITALPGQQAAAQAAGVGSLLEKPLDIPLLLATMRRLLAEPLEARLARITGKTLPIDSHEPPRRPFIAASENTARQSIYGN